MGAFSLCFVGLFFYNYFIHNMLYKHQPLGRMGSGLVGIFKAL